MYACRKGTAVGHNLDLATNASFFERLNGLFHLGHRGGQQRRFADNLRIVFFDRIHKLLGGDIGTKIIYITYQTYVSLSNFGVV